MVGNYTMLPLPEGTALSRSGRQRGAKPVPRDSAEIEDILNAEVRNPDAS